MAVYKGRHVTVVRDVVPPGAVSDQVIIRHMDGTEEAVTRSKVKYSKDEKVVKDKLVAEPTYIEPVTLIDEVNPRPNLEAVDRPLLPGEKGYVARKEGDRTPLVTTAPKQPDRPVSGLFQAKKPM
jgi:hypothetical protein